jgi:hypothetical protein
MGADSAPTKLSVGFKIGKMCPCLQSADMIVGENTCIGKR